MTAFGKWKVEVARFAVFFQPAVKYPLIAHTLFPLEDKILISAGVSIPLI